MDGAGGFDSAAICQQACNKLANAECGDLTSEVCVECPPDPVCQGALDEYGKCVIERGVPRCEEGFTTARECDAELQKHWSCTACVAQEFDTTCDSCVKTTCCTELRGFFDAADFSGFDACMPLCDSAECQSDCRAQFPDAGAAYQRLLTCQADSCGC